MTKVDGQTFQVNVLLNEKGADRQRLRRLSTNLRRTLHDAESCEVSLLSRNAEGGAKGAVEFLPGALMVILGVTANIPRFSRILDVWLTRDRGRSVTLKNAKAEESVIIDGMSAEDVARIIEVWRLGGVTNESTGSTDPGDEP